MKIAIGVIAAFLVFSSACFVYDCCQVYADTNSVCSGAVGKKAVDLETIFSAVSFSESDQQNPERAFVKMGSAGQCEFEIKGGIVSGYSIHVSNKFSS